MATTKITGDLEVTGQVKGGSFSDSDVVTAYAATAAGTHTTAGGDATETITVSGLTASDFVHVYVSTAGATPRTINGYGAGAGSITVNMSGDPSTDHVLSYVVFKATS
ncbi:MAG: hypothetical protein DWQ49_08905 [Bacteroidetes bacterium]|nr:MAG: hypothetical protein DWQ49_08905 [Bacteroidota bacterium]